MSTLNLYFWFWGPCGAPNFMATQKDKVASMDIQGKQIVNFQLSLIVYSLLSIPLIFVFGLGILTLIAICIISVVIPIVNAIKVNNQEPPVYFMNIDFIK